MSSFELKKSDIAGALVSTTYESGLKLPSGMQFGEKLAYQTLSRVASNTLKINYDVPYVDVPLLDLKDIYTGFVASADSVLRKRKTMKSAFFDGLQEALSSYAGKQLLLITNMEDTSLFGGSGGSTAQLA